MLPNYIGERWKNVNFDFHYVNDNRIEISNFGRVRSFNRISDGKIMKGSMINGYKIIRLKFFVERDEVAEKKFLYYQKQIEIFAKKIRKMKLEKAKKKEIKDAEILLLGLRANLKQKFAKDWTNRAINYHSLVHRLVATYFLKKPKINQTIVGHLDHNKLNNSASNLKWMTHAENIEHIQNNPIGRKNNPLIKPTNAKLTVTKVMLLKKLLNEGKSVKSLVKQFKISDMQIYRIKNGENWADIPAAV
ncbi:MAG: HNH endonuclease [Ferruginibacter sp.]|nr:helix-turn-helix domain-containing protein [Ferruginibacter sp.]